MSDISRKIYSTKQWRELRARVLQEEPTCHWCHSRPSTQADHVIEIDRAPELAYDRDNLVGSCRPCNSKRGSTYQAKKNAARKQRVFGSTPPSTPPPHIPVSPQGVQNVDTSVDIEATSVEVGRIEPRLATPTLGDETYGPRVAEWAARHLPGEFMEWQKLAIDGQLEHDEDGQLLRNESLVSVARRNGKSYGMMALIGWWCTEMPQIAGRPQRVISTAHKLDRAFGLFKELAPILEARYDAKVNWSYGRNFVEFKDGTTWHVMAATPQNAHGAGADAVLIDEVWSVGPEVVFDAFRPTMTAQPNPLMSMWSTAGDESSKVMQQLREQAIQAIDAGTESALYFAEWSPPPGANLEDPNTWAWSNPALGNTISLKRLKRMSETPNRQAFYRAHCNVWISASAAWLPAGHWDSCYTDDPMPDGGYLAVDSDVTDLRYCGVRVCADDDGRLHVKTEFVVDNARAMFDEITDAMQNQALSLALTPGLAALCPVELQRRLHIFGQQEMTKFTAIVRNLILERRLVHHGQLALAEQVNRAVAGRSSGTITLSSQKSPGPIEQTRCMVAAAGLAAAPQQKIRKPMLGIAK